MAIAEKLQNIINEKSQQATMTNYGLPSANQINSSTKFIDYPKYIFNAFLEALRTPDTLFTNLPKKSGSGANITLNDTANAPMRIELSPSELSQDGTPTPDSPQDIHTISGSNKIVVCGKNLFDYNDLASKIQTLTINGNASNFTINGNGTYNYSIALIGQHKITGNWSTTSLNGDVKVIYEDDTTGSLIELYSGSSGSGTINLTTADNKNIKAIRFRTFNTGNVTISNLQIEKGTTATTYEPYTSQEADIDLDTLEYCKIGNYEDKFIRTSGKNLFDKDNLIDGWIRWNDGYYFNQYADTFNCTDYIEVEPNTTYTLNLVKTDNLGSAGILQYNSSKTLIQEGIQENNKYNTFTTTSTTKYVRFTVRVDSKDTIMFVKGNYTSSTMPDYEPYGSNEWYIKKNIGKVVLVGTGETYSFNGTAGDYTEFVYTPTIAKIKGQLNMISNYFPNTTLGIERILGRDDNGNIYFRILTTTASTTNEFQTWLSTHNTEIYYALATPTYTQITGTLANQLENVYKKMMSQKGQTNISQVNNDLAFEMSVSAIEEL